MCTCACNLVDLINVVFEIFAGSREKIVSAMYRATALLICAKGTSTTPLTFCIINLCQISFHFVHCISLSYISGIDRPLLYSISQLPVKKFNEVPISVAIECWQWLLTNRPDLEYPVRTHTLKLCIVYLHLYLSLPSMLLWTLNA